MRNVATISLNLSFQFLIQSGKKKCNDIRAKQRAKTHLQTTKFNNLKLKIAIQRKGYILHRIKEMVITLRSWRASVI